MPDKFGFDHYGNGVRCIDCGAGGPIWKWKSRDRELHYAKHESARARAQRAQAKKAQRERVRLLKQINKLRQEARQ